MNFLVGLFTELASVVGGMLNGVLGNTVAIMKSGIGTAQAFHQEGISLARDLGMGLNQANAYTKVLAERTMDLASKYGVAKEAIIAVQRNLSETTGKQLMLNDAQAESFVQANKLIGEGTTNEFIDNIMNGMGGQVSAVEKAISKAYATASKQGLNAKKFSKTVADNLSMANRLNFRNGVDGIAKMAAMSEKLGLNLKDVETAANKFMDLDSAIESSAHLQMLGGSIGASFGNPLTNAYESMYDPEAFAERMENAIKGMASFDESKGYATVSPINQEILANYAKEMGLNKEDVIKNAKKQAEVNYKEQRFGGKLNSLGLSEEQKNFLINNGQIKNGELYYTDAKGGEHNVSRNDVNGDLINEMMQFSNMSDSDLMRSQAASLTSIEEALKGNADATGAAFAKGLKLEKRAEGIKNVINEVGSHTKQIAEYLGGAVGKALDGISKFIMSHKDTFKKIAEGITKMFSFLTEHWKLLLGAIVGLKAAKFLGNTPGGRKLGAKAAKGAWNGIKGLFTTSRDTNIATRMGYTSARTAGNGRFMSALKAPFKGATLLSSGQKIANVGGAALGVGISAVQGIMAQSAYKDQVEAINRGEWDKEKYKTKEEALASAQTERNEGVGGAIGSGIGTVIGTAVAGPIGAAVGGWLGNVGGKYIGKHWEDIKEFAKSAWEGTKEFAKSAWEGTKEFAKGVWELVPEDARNSISHAMEYITPAIKGTWEGIKVVALGAWSAIKGAALGAWSAIKGTALGIWEVIKGSALGVWEVVKGAALGVWEMVKGVWNGLWDIISAPFKAVGDIIDGFKNGFDQILNGDILNGILTMLGGVGKGIFDIISAPFKAIFDIGKGAFSGIFEIGKGIWNGIGEFAKGIWNGIGEFVKGIWNGIGEFVKGVFNGVKGVWNSAKSWVSEKWNKLTGHANGGIVGGNSYSGDNVLTRVNSGEMVLNRTQQSNLFSLIQNIPSILTSVLTNSNDVKAKPVGGKEYVYIPTNGNGGLNGVSEITVKDINLNINGTLKLDAGSLTNTLDIRQLLSDTSFISQMKELIKESINNDINNGRFMNDMASMRGMPSQVGLWGLK